MVGLQFLQTLVHRRHELRSGIIADPHFRGNEDLVARNTGCPDGESDVSFILVHLSRIDMAKALPECSDKNVLEPRPGHPVRSKSKHRNVCPADSQNCAGCIATAEDWVFHFCAIDNLSASLGLFDGIKVVRPFGCREAVFFRMNPSVASDGTSMLALGLFAAATNSFGHGPCLGHFAFRRRSIF